MRLRTPTQEQARSSTESPADSASGSGLLRHLLTAIGILALAYTASRVLDSVEEGSTQHVNEIQEQLLDPAPDDLVRSLAGTGNRADDAETEPERDADTSGVDAIDDADANADYTQEARSDEEIAERAESDVQDKPAEPGEMAVDEDVAEELIDDESDIDAESTGENDETADSAE